MQENIRDSAHVNVIKLIEHDQVVYKKRWLPQTTANPQGMPFGDYWARREFDILRRLNNRKLNSAVEFIGVDYTKCEIVTKDAGISLDRLPSVQDVVSSQYLNHPLEDISELLKLGRRVLMCFKDIHANNIIHGDIKLDNICIDIITTPTMSYIYYPNTKLIDFAFSIDKSCDIIFDKPLIIKVTDKNGDSSACAQYLPEYYKRAISLDYTSFEQGEPAPYTNAMNAACAEVDLFSLGWMLDKYMQEGVKNRFKISLGSVEDLIEHFKSLTPIYTNNFNKNDLIDKFIAKIENILLKANISEFDKSFSFNIIEKNTLKSNWMTAITPIRDNKNYVLPNSFTPSNISNNLQPPVEHQSYTAPTVDIPIQPQNYTSESINNTNNIQKNSNSNFNNTYSYNPIQKLFTISIFKLIILHVLTFNLYGIYWLYKQIQGFSLPNDTFAANFNIIKTLNRINEYSKKYNLSKIHLDIWLILYFIAFLFSFAFIPIAVLFIIPIQRRVNKIKMLETHKKNQNSNITPLNLFWIGLSLGLCVYLFYSKDFAKQLKKIGTSFTTSIKDTAYQKSKEKQVLKNNKEVEEENKSTDLEQQKAQEKLAQEKIKQEEEKIQQQRAKDEKDKLEAEKLANSPSIPYINKANNGDTEAQFQLGLMYAGEKNQIQENSPVDYAKSIQYLNKAAKQGHGDAMNMLGIMYEDGKGVKQSDKRALQYYYKAMELGSKGGAVNYANFIAQHPKAAQEVYQEAASEYLKNNKDYQNLMDLIKR